MSGFDKKTEVSRLDFDFAPVASLALVLRNILDNRDCGVSHTWEEICFKLEKKILQNLDIELTSLVPALHDIWIITVVLNPTI